MDDEWEADKGAFPEPSASEARVLLARLPVELLLQATNDVYEDVFGHDQVSQHDIAEVAAYIGAGKVDEAHFAMFSERSRRALAGSYRLQELHLIYQALIAKEPDQKKLLDRVINHAFFSGMMLATGCERIGDLVAIAQKSDLRKQKQSDAAWETARKRTEWKRDARELYDSVRRDHPGLVTATKIVAQMNETRRIAGSSDEQLLKLVRYWRSEDRKVAQSLPKGA